ncbi:MAG: aminopeptidase N [Micromonosporaceae bacterium]|nr:aminopeptidase N [Micromonosporaceae bacterium]
MPSLTRAEAAARAELLRVSAYHVDLDLSAARDSAHFGSTTTVRFSCTRPGSSTFAELRATSIVAARLNGAPLPAEAYADGRLQLTDLRADNELVVHAEMPYSNTGEGLHKFTDPEDGEVYLYAKAGQTFAPDIFACFDQPDLKATIRLAVTAPATAEGDPSRAQWTVLANGAGTQVAPGRWEFADTPVISTYLMTVVAGPYHGRHIVHDGVPLGVYCRRSLAAQLDKDSEELFRITVACLDRYHELFQIRYPFGKYDQVFVPEFPAGAEENPGCVTVREELLFRSAATAVEREFRAMVIAHEMAHMWFGNLVTLRWWDDIWLNESFAEYMGWRVTAEVTEFTGAWTNFAIIRKGWGYTADQLPSTHPVAPEHVETTELARLNFDGISYAKGASVLRQLVAWVGDDAFLRGVRAFFQAHAYGNATLADLLAAISEASGRDLTGWAEAWLRRPQVNTLRPEVTIGPDGRYREVTVVQTAPPTYPTLRPHRIGIGVYDVELRHRVEVALDPVVDGGRTPVPELTGVEAGRLLLLNDGDLTYAKIRFDPASRAELAALLPSMVDPLARALVWSAAMDATRDAELPAVEFMALAMAGLPVETAEAVFDGTLRFAREVVAKKYLRPALRPAAMTELAAACQRALRAASPGSSRQLAAARGLSQCAGLEEVELLAAWLAGRQLPPELTLDADLRWTVLYRLVVIGAAGEAEIAAELDRDPSALGAEHAARCRAAVPSAEAKARAWDTILHDDQSSARLVTAAAEGFWQPEQEQLTEEYVPRYFAEMPAMAARRPSGTARLVARFAFPQYAVSAQTVAAAEAMLAREDISPTLRRVVLDETDELRRALAAREIS